MNNVDRERLEFLIGRDGIDGATDFAKRCIVIYRRAALSGKKKYRKRFLYRTVYIKSYAFHKSWVAAC